MVRDGDTIWTVMRRMLTQSGGWEDCPFCRADEETRADWHTAGCLLRTLPTGDGPYTAENLTADDIRGLWEDTAVPSELDFLVALDELSLLDGGLRRQKAREKIARALNGRRR